jgi:hypothetical protein
VSEYLARPSGFVCGSGPTQRLTAAIGMVLACNKAADTVIALTMRDKVNRENLLELVLAWVGTVLNCKEPVWQPVLQQSNVHTTMAGLWTPIADRRRQEEGWFKERFGEHRWELLHKQMTQTSWTV